MVWVDQEEGKVEQMQIEENGQIEDGVNWRMMT